MKRVKLVCFSLDKQILPVGGQRASTGGLRRRSERVKTKLVTLIRTMETPPPPSLERPAAGLRVSLCLSFVMRCHLALLAVQRPLSSPCDAHAHDMITPSLPLLPHWTEADIPPPPVHILMDIHLPLALCSAATPPHTPRESFHINETGLYALFYICLWYCEAFGAKGRAEGLTGVAGVEGGGGGGDRSHVRLL